MQRARWRDMELPSRVVPDRDTLTHEYGRFTIEPFERGFGTTLGNGLRRVLLASLEGAAPVSVKIRGADHEFQPLDGVVEDVTDIVLAIKQLVIRMTSPGPVTLRLSKKKKGDVLAADFAAEGDVEILNPDLRICTLSKAADLDIECIAWRGRGYVTADEHREGSRGPLADPRRVRADEVQEIGRIFVDSIFSPVRRVRTRIEETRVGRITNYDKLIVEIWTNGSVRPEDALVEAAKIYRKYMNPFVFFGTQGPEVAPGDAFERAPTLVLGPADAEGRLVRPIADLGLSVRANNCLEAAGIRTVGDLVARTADDLLAIKNLGDTSLEEIRGKLGASGLALAGETASPPPLAGGLELTPVADTDEDEDEEK